MAFLFMNHGDKHLDHLAVAIYRLRFLYPEHYPIRIASTPCDTNTANILHAIARDGHCEVVDWTPDYNGKNAGYVMKTHMFDLTRDWPRTLFMDADTLTVGDLHPLIHADTQKVHVTQFCQWTTFGRIISKRIKEWADASPHEVARALQTEYPAINTGVLAWSDCHKDWHDRWRSLTYQNIRFICDEIACQLMFMEGDCCVVQSDRYNASVQYSSRSENDVAIWHGHGRKFFRKDAGWRIWSPYYRAALADNFADLDRWSPINPKLRNRLNAVATAEASL